jgi:hypothetical protein
MGIITLNDGKVGTKNKQAYRVMQTKRTCNENLNDTPVCCFCSLTIKIKHLNVYFFMINFVFIEII